MFETVISMKELMEERMRLLKEGTHSPEEINEEFDRVKRSLKSTYRIDGDDQINKTVEMNKTKPDSSLKVEVTGIVVDKLPISLGSNNYESPTLEINILNNGRICFTKNF